MKKEITFLFIPLLLYLISIYRKLFIYFIENSNILSFMITSVFAGIVTNLSIICIEWLINHKK